jgi:hypothetical protein
MKFFFSKFIVFFYKFYFSLTDRNILSKILNDLERSDKTDNQRLEDKALDEFQ